MVTEHERDYGPWQDALLAYDDEDYVAYRAAQDRYWDGGDRAARLEALDLLKKIARRGKFLSAES